MDAWKYLPDGRSVCLTEEFDFQFENHGYNTKSIGCELKPMSNNESYTLDSNTQPLERLDFMDMGLDEVRRSYSISSEPSGEVFSDEIGDDCGSFATPFGDQEKHFSSRNPDSNTHDFSFVDLKLGGLAVNGGTANHGDFSDATLVESSSMSISPAKRSRSTSLFIQSPSCQVLGCNKDLSSHKGYYRRHKVCDEHTRSAKVIVKGMEQRFCQQCSRFHQVAEFDDGKRSCRRRLAAHNKRRRKPRFSSETGMDIIDFSSSHTRSEGLPSTSDGSGRYEAWKWVDNVKVEDSSESSNVFFHASPANAKNNNNFTGTTAMTILNSSTVEQSSRALSLLSAQSRTSSYQLPRTNSVTSSLFNDTSPLSPGNHSEKPDYAVGTSSGHGTVVDLNQLSSHLRRIEQLRDSTKN